MTMLVALLVAMNIGIEQLTDKTITGAEILFVRSVFNLIAATFIIILCKGSIIPTDPGLQVGAFICLGLSLLLIFTAYQYISAGSVSTLQRLDIPLLVLIAAFSNKLKLSQILLALLAFIIVAVLIVANKTTDEDPIGYFIVLSAVVLLSINTVLQKKIAVSENIQTIIFISSLSSAFWGGISCWQSNASFVNIHLDDLLIIVGLSVINLFIFFLVNDIYKKKSPEVVRYPYLLAAFLTMIIEMIIEHKVFNSILIIGNFSIIFVLTLLLRNSLNNAATNEAH